MAYELPIACTLPAEQLSDRLGEMSAVGRTHLRSVTSGARRAELCFAPAARARLERLVAAERRCCGFLDLGLEERADQLLLSIEGPAGAEAVLDGLVAAFAGE